MKYVSLSGFEAYAGESAWRAWSEKTSAPEAALRKCESRLIAAIFPASPRTAAQTEAFCSAVYAQLLSDFETDQSLGPIPEGVTAYSALSFSVKLSPRRGLCPAARAFLLQSGLLTREVGAC